MTDRIEFEALVVDPEECLNMADDGCGIMDVWSTENVIRVPARCHRGSRYRVILIPTDDERRDTQEEATDD